MMHLPCHDRGKCCILLKYKRYFRLSSEADRCRGGDKLTFYGRNDQLGHFLYPSPYFSLELCEVIAKQFGECLFLRENLELVDIEDEQGEDSDVQEIAEPQCPGDEYQEHAKIHGIARELINAGSHQLTRGLRFQWIDGCFTFVKSHHRSDVDPKPEEQDEERNKLDEWHVDVGDIPIG